MLGGRGVELGAVSGDGLGAASGGERGGELGEMSGSGLGAENGGGRGAELGAVNGSGLCGDCGEVSGDVFGAVSGGERGVELGAVSGDGRGIERGVVNGGGRGVELGVASGDERGVELCVVNGGGRGTELVGGLGAERGLKADLFVNEIAERDILDLCGSGILVTDFNGGNCNSATGDFSYGVSGFLFENGKITSPIDSMLITGNMTDLWSNLLACRVLGIICQVLCKPGAIVEDSSFSAHQHGTSCVHINCCNTFSEVSFLSPLCKLVSCSL